MYEEQIPNTTLTYKFTDRLAFPTPFDRGAYRAFMGPERGNVAAVALTGSDEKPSVRETEELTEGLPQHVVRVVLTEATYDLGGQIKTGDVLEIQDDIHRLRPLEAAVASDKPLMKSLIETLVRVAGHQRRSPAQRFSGFAPPLLYRRDGDQVVYLPGISNPKNWPEIVKPYLPESGSIVGTVASDTREQLLCGNIVRVLFFFIHGVSAAERNVHRVKNRRLRHQWRKLLDTTNLDDLHALLLESFVDSTVTDTRLRPDRTRGSRRGLWAVLLPLLLLASLLVAAYWRWDVVGPYLERIMQRAVSNPMSEEMATGAPSATGEPPHDPAKPFAAQEFLIYDATVSTESEPSSGNPREKIFIPKPSEVENLRNVIAAKSDVTADKVSFDPTSGVWTIEQSPRYLQDILDVLVQKEVILLGQTEQGRDFRFFEPSVLTRGEVRVRTMGENIIPGAGQLLLVFEAQNPPGEGNRYRTLTFRREGEPLHVLDLSQDGNQVAFEPYFGREYDLIAERTEGGVDTCRGVVLCTQDEEAMRAALTELFHKAKIDVNPGELAAFYQANEGSDRFFLIRPQPLLRLLRNHFSSPDRAHGQTIYEFKRYTG
jgi:hypothetical protein